MAEKAGIGAIGLALFLGLVNIKLAAVPLTLFLMMCFTAPLMPSIGFFLPVISRGSLNKWSVAITFDDGPDPVFTPKLLDLLAKYQVGATFFVNGKNVEHHPGLIKKILSQGHSIGNHTYSHDNFIMLKTSHALMKEITDTQRALRPFGIVPVAFRPPVGVTSPRLKNVLEQLGMVAVNFNRRAGDMGNRRIGHLASRVLNKLKPGDIIMLHDIMPRNEALMHTLFNELEQLLKGIHDKQLSILPLSELIERPVMITL